MLQRQYVLVTVVAGECHTPQQRFEWGVSSPALSVGAGADWVIFGKGISDVHLLLSFDGRSVRATAASDSARVEVVGEEALGVESRILELPFELRLGTARLVGQVVGGAVARTPDVLPDFAAGAPSGPSFALAAGSSVKTQVFALAALRVPHLEKHAPAHVGQVISSVGRSEPPFQVVSGSTRVWSFSTPRPPAPYRCNAEEHTPLVPMPLVPMPGSPVLALDRTLCDGGALRDYARQLLAEVTDSVGATADRPNAMSPAPRLSRGARALRLPSNLLALKARRPLLVMPALASLGLLPWLLGALFAQQSSPANEPVEVAEAVPAEAPPAQPSRAPSAGAAPAPAPGDVVAEAPRDVVAEAVPDASAAPPPTVSPRSRGREQDAFRAAFGGSVAEAAALYDELAQARREPVFAHAARLARQNRLHKP